MSPLVSDTATTPVSRTYISAQMRYISGSPVMQDVVAANDTEPKTKRSIIERRRKRQTRRAAH